MFRLDTDEKILAVIHRHWFVISWKLSMLALLLLPPVIGLLLTGIFVTPQYVALTLFFICIYILIVLLGGLLAWMDFYLDMWVITTKRVLDVEQVGLFNRSVSEFAINKIQDVSITIPGLFATILRYGNITAQTAGEESFSIRDIPRPEHVKDLILRCHDELCKVGRSEPQVDK